MKQTLTCAVVVQVRFMWDHMEIYSLMAFVPGQNCVIERLGGTLHWVLGGLGASLFTVSRTVVSQRNLLKILLLYPAPTVSLKQRWPHGCCYAMVISIPHLQGLLLQMGSWAPACLQHFFGACLKPALCLCCQESFMKKRHECILPEHHIWVKVNQMYFECKFTRTGEQCKNWYWYLNQWFWCIEEKWSTKLFISL